MRTTDSAGRFIRSLLRGSAWRSASSRWAVLRTSQPPKAAADGSPRREPWVQSAKMKSPDRGDRIESRILSPALRALGNFGPIPMADAMGYRLPPASRG